MFDLTTIQIVNWNATNNVAFPTNPANIRRTSTMFLGEADKLLTSEKCQPRNRSEVAVILIDILSDRVG